MIIRWLNQNPSVILRVSLKLLIDCWFLLICVFARNCLGEVGRWFVECRNARNDSAFLIVLGCLNYTRLVLRALNSSSVCSRDWFCFCLRDLELFSSVTIKSGDTLLDTLSSLSDINHNVSCHCYFIRGWIEEQEPTICKFAMISHQN